MQEDFLHFIWKNRLFKSDALETVSGEPIEILKLGFHNFDAGPDFIDARIKIGETLWAGNVEIHLKSSDWNNHQHQNDKAYDNVILHVVKEYDKSVKTISDREVPTFIMQFNPEHLSRYNALVESMNFIYCEDKISEYNNFKLNIWLNRILVQRIQRKSSKFKEILQSTGNNWEEAFYIYLASNFGFKTNALPFEMLARSTPIKVFAKHKKSLLQIEAILFGQAGFLNETKGDDYYDQLKKEYDFLKSKFNLKSIDNYLWKFLRLRPANFPSIRIAQFASLIHKSSGLFSKVLETSSISDIEKLFDIKTSQYWESHYKFNEVSVKKIKRFGAQSVRNIVINTLVPVLFIYGQEKDNDKIKELSMNILESLSAEKNNIIARWAAIGIMAENAFYSQALIELYNELCKQKKCLHCDIGREIITKYE